MTVTDTPTAPTIQTTVGDLVTRRPSWSRVFEKLGIDYCCGGKKPLEEVCRSKGLDPNTILTTLLATEGNAGDEGRQDWATASLTELADHIEQTHHAYLKRELPRLGAMVRKVAAVHGENHPWMLELDGVYIRFAAEMEAHMMKEEQMLFPMIRSVERGESAATEPCGHGIDAPIRVMEHEHDAAGDDLLRMRELSDGFRPPAHACNTFRAMLDGLAELEDDTHRHVHKENSILFPRAQDAYRAQCRN